MMLRQEIDGSVVIGSVSAFLSERFSVVNVAEGQFVIKSFDNKYLSAREDGSLVLLSSEQLSKPDMTEYFGFETDVATVKKSRFLPFLDKFQNWLYIAMEMPAGFPQSYIGMLLNFIVILAVLASLVCFVLSTETWADRETRGFLILSVIQFVCLGIFCVDFLVRLYACTAPIGPYYRFGAILGRIWYCCSISFVIDVVSIVPPFVMIIIDQVIKSGSKVLFLRELIALRIMLIFRVFRFEKYFSTLTLIKNVVVLKYKELMVAVFFYLSSVMVIAVAIYLAESSGQPDGFGTMLQSLYWSCIALSTGNISSVPATVYGKFINVFASIMAYTFIALPTSIIGCGLIEQIDARREEERKEAEKLKVSTITKAVAVELKAMTTQKAKNEAKK